MKTQHVFVFGASNVTLGFRQILSFLSQTYSPLHVHITAGHGRSWGKWSKVLVRALPAILRAQVWQVLDELPDDEPARALITDIGNDVLYGVEANRICDWVEETICRLSARNIPIAMTSLPNDSIERLSPARFKLFRTLMFPGNTMTFEELQQTARDLDRGVTSLAEQTEGLAYVSPQPDWYGIDPIHIVRRARRAAWSHYLSQWPGTPQETNTTAGKIPGPVGQFRLGQKECAWFGKFRSYPQPAWVNGQLKVSLY